MTTMTTPPVDTAAVERFLSGHRIAIVGASNGPKNFGETVYREMRSRGYDVVPVHPTASDLDGDPCATDLASVEGDLDGVIVMVPADRSAGVVRQCIDRGVERVWLFKGIGSDGAVSAEAVELSTEHGLDLVAGACPMMFLEPVGWFHRVHRSARRHNGSLVTVSA
jgi:predicted CoA-binding protein